MGKTTTANEVDGFVIGVNRTTVERRANLENLRTLVAAAANSTLVLPAGDIEFELDLDLDRMTALNATRPVVGLYINHDVEIRGMGRRTTRLQVYPRESPIEFGRNFIYVDGFISPRTVTITDLQIIAGDEDPGDADEQLTRAFGQRASIASNTVTLTTVANAARFATGKTVFAGPNEDGSSLRTGSTTISSINLTAGTLTLANASAILGFANGDYIFQQGVVRTHGIEHQGKAGAGVGDELITLERVDITGHWGLCVDSHEGDLLLNCTDCCFEASETTVGMFATTNANKRLHLTNCSIHLFGGDGDNAVTGVYISPCCSGRFVGCNFTGFTAYGLYWNGTATAPAKYGIVDSCYFQSATLAEEGDGLPQTPFPRGMQAKLNGSLVVNNCRFSTKEECIRLWPNLTDATISNCSFELGEESAAITVNTGVSGATLAGKPIRITSCTFKGEGSTSGLVDCGQSGTFVLTGCDFILNAANRCVATHEDSDVTLIGCTFYSTIANSIAVSHSPTSTGTGSLKMVRCTTQGVIRGLRWSDSSASITAKAFLDGNYFDSTGRPLDLNLGTSNVIRGSGNRMINVLSSGLQISNSTTYQRIGLRQAINDASTASANAIRLDPSYDTHHITGNAAIKSIYFVSATETGTPTVASVNTKQFEGVIKLIVDANWSTDSVGNIRPLSTGARTINSVVTLVFDPKTEVWYEL
jgi:hypothetical protein